MHSIFLVKKAAYQTQGYLKIGTVMIISSFSFNCNAFYGAHPIHLILLLDSQFLDLNFAVGIIVGFSRKDSLVWAYRQFAGTLV